MSSDLLNPPTPIAHDVAGVNGKAPILTAVWQNLVLLNYEIDSDRLQPYVPAGTQLDEYNGRSLVTVAGFMFRKARFWRFPAIGHKSFPEVNLRFYVRRPHPHGDRPGIVFLKELVPRRLVAWIARHVYGENFQYTPMHYRFDPAEALEDAALLRRAEYRWCHRGHQGVLSAVVGSAQYPTNMGEIAFVARRNWAYSVCPDGSTWEYYVDHPPWTVRPASIASLQWDAAELCVPRFQAALSADPSSACLIDGSAVTVYPGRRLPLG